MVGDDADRGVLRGEGEGGEHACEHAYQVRGMTCEHCVAAVQREVGAIDGAEAVAVDLDSGRLLVRGRDVDEDAVRAAVEEAGYSLA